MRLLVVNAGSSSTKVRVVEEDDRVSWRADLGAPTVAADGDPALVGALSEAPGPFDAVAHRVVHGGRRFRGPAVVDEETEGALRALADLAPLHQAPALAGLEAAARAFPGAPMVACFDTAFHATLPAAAATYAVPARWREELGVHRYGFHGLSHAWATVRAAAMLGVAAVPRLVVCHLGAGASLAAVAEGRSVDTTMGFTPLEGLAMATRSGSIDPGIVPWLVAQAGEALAAVADALEHRSGMVALAGTADMAAVVRGAAAGEEAARLALDVYLHRLRAGVAAMAAALGGLDALVFTGGVGEHGGAVRRGAAAGLGFLGVGIDEEANAGAVPDAEITASGAPVRSLVIAAREELQMAAEVRALLRA
ncbi:MAG: acetate/propionate family kinase [Acidobacteriota bacterium]|nr:acetate/propionate family kinase [Acidobacteriota bacterium]